MLIVRCVELGADGEAVLDQIVVLAVALTRIINDV
jgi:hypothetical protein